MRFLSFCFAAITAAAASAQPMMGWSSWNAFKVHINEQIICRQAFLLDSLGLKDAGYTFVNIDDGFFGRRPTPTTIEANVAKFPNGMRVLTDYVHNLGLKAGIYTDAGTRTCGSIWDGDVAGRVAGIYGHEQSDSKVYFRDWNFDFIKIDYCGGSDLNLDEQQRYTAIYDAVQRYGRPDVRINICRWAYPGTWAEKAAASWRISGDITAQWSSLKYVVGKNLYLSAFCRGGKFNDMDMLVLGMRGKGRLDGTGLTDIEDETHMALWCIMSSPLLIGCDLSRLSQKSLALLKNRELIALNQDPLNLQARVYQHIGDTYVLAKDIEKREGKVRAVALYNQSDSIHTFSVALSTLCLAGKTKVRDLIHHTNLKSVSDTLVLTVEPHATACLRLEADKRLEATAYEAEWAYLPCFNDLGKSDKTITTTKIDGASGSMGVKNIGGMPENVLCWEDVYSHNGGSYQVTVSYTSPKEALNMHLWTNGDDEQTARVDKTEQVATTTFNITLKKGVNTITIGNPYDWAPNIDKIELKKL